MNIQYNSINYVIQAMGKYEYLKYIKYDDIETRVMYDLLRKVESKKKK